EMLGLTQLTKPGPFGQRTRELGSYLGIRKNGVLVAMAGERLRVPGHTEVSAVCTHPDHLGRGYAASLMRAVMQRIRDRGETPFLHVRHDNERAIGLYRRLGFRDRALLHLSVVRRSRPVGFGAERIARRRGKGTHRLSNTVTWSPPGKQIPRFARNDKSLVEHLIRAT
ncbi:MAG: hypothetical protein DMG68_03950, partial [Acidobacteria bacterium]